MRWRGTQQHRQVTATGAAAKSRQTAAQGNMGTGGELPELFAAMKFSITKTHSRSQATHRWYELPLPRPPWLNRALPGPAPTSITSSCANSGVVCSGCG